MTYIAIIIISLLLLNLICGAIIKKQSAIIRLQSKELYEKQYLEPADPDCSYWSDEL